ncbi:MAG: serine/threonine protein kinase [Gemmatimonadota bacterium]|nr:MAG: serine/threonine protein kinase [Gemmatimonadota bacterium]
MSVTTMLRPDSEQRGGRLGPSGRRATLPPDLLQQAVGRLRAVALLFAVAVLVMNFVAALFTVEGQEYTYSHVIGWLPGVLAIAAALFVVWLTTWQRASVRTKLAVGLVFQVIGGFAIAMAQWWGLWDGVEDLSNNVHFQRSLGISWVAVWVVLFTVVVPTKPRLALLASVVTGATVPLTVALSTAFGGTPAVNASFFFWGFVFPYVVLTPVAARIGSRVVHQLGTEVQRARELGGYVLEERLGAGGMGEVWRARHRLLARPAAVKFIRPEVLSGGDGGSQRVILARFQREAQATAAMRCPHTIELYDFGVADDGTFYYVMELLDGFDLESLVTRFGPLPPQRVLHVLRQVCHALGEAHQNGLIHRDVKPGNIYVCRYGREYDWVKVLDFGMVKSLRSEGEASLKLTAETIMGGTPAYMAPEQAFGDGTIDGRADIYQAGCVAYFALTGQLVFTGRTPVQMILRHAREAPLPPSSKIDAAIPPELDALVLRCLAKDPADRFQTADELAAAVMACAQGLPPWTSVEAGEWWGAQGVR